MTIAATLVTGLALAPAAIAGDERGKHMKKDRDFSSMKHQNKQHRNSYADKHSNKHNSSHRNGHNNVYSVGHKKHHKHGHGSHKKMKHNKHYDHNYRRHHGHHGNHTVVNQYDVYDHGHSHSYYDPRIRIGLHLGHFDLLFQD